jgi:hypothetical protein
MERVLQLRRIMFTARYELNLSDIIRVKFNFSSVWCTGVADKSLSRPTSRSILFENISFDASLVLYIYIFIVLIFLQL